MGAVGIVNPTPGGGGAVDSVDNMTGTVVLASTYAGINHTHSQYAASTHTHTEYAASGHLHTGIYSPMGHTHTEYAASGHNHDGVYSVVGHLHTEYAASGHNHDLVYASIGHNHDGVYSVVGHNHDGAYSAIGHNHDGVYSVVGHTHTEYAASGHNHDAAYSQLGHSHTEYAASTHTHTEYAASTHSHTEYAASGHVHTEYAASGHTHTEYAASAHTHVQLQGALSPKTGRWYAIPRGNMGSTLTLALNRAFVVPLPMRIARTLTDISVEVGSASAPLSGGVIRAGLLSSLADMDPDSWLEDFGTKSSETTGSKEWNSLSEALADDTLYWIGVVAQVAACGVRQVASYNEYSSGTASPTGTTAAGGMSSTAVWSGTLSGGWTFSALDGAPRIGVKFS